MPEMNIKCKDCGTDFVVSEDEQAFFASKNFDIPKRCRPCRMTRKRQQNAERQQEDNNGGSY